MNTQAINQVAMKINQTNLLKSLRFSFTNQTTVLGELLQNARRAKATEIIIHFDAKSKTLQVCDNGCGIKCIDTLLTIAESGWDQELLASEHPYGIGFLSALFACRHLEVISKSGKLAIDTETILSFRPVSVQPVEQWDGTTLITLSGITLDSDKILKTLSIMALGFPIPVMYNGERLERPEALDAGLDFVTTDIGEVYLQGLKTPSGVHREFDVFLQGLPIYKSSYAYRSQHHIIHLNSAKFRARPNSMKPLQPR